MNDKIEEQKLVIETNECLVIFYSTLLHEAQSRLSYPLSEKEESYISKLEAERALAEDSYFDALAELWIMQSENTPLPEGNEL